MKLLSSLAASLLFASSAGAQTIQNASFETGDFTGWTVTPAAAGSVVELGALADNGAIPQGSKVAALTGGYPITPGLSQSISGLVVGGYYWVSCRINVKGDNTHHLTATLSVGTDTIATKDQFPVGGTNDYYRLEGYFTATSTTHVLEIVGQAVSTETLLVDDFKIAATRDPIVVANTANNGDGSLRKVLTDAAASLGPDTITFAPGLSGQTISLESMISINDTDGVTVDATSLPGGITINDGAGITYGLFALPVGSKATFRGLTFANGGGSGMINGTVSGGAFYSQGTLTLEYCCLNNNSAYEGGAIMTQAGGVTTLTNCTLTANTATRGGAIGCRLATVALTHCTVARNTASGEAGGIYVDQGSATLTNSIVFGNLVAGSPPAVVDIFLSGSNPSTHKVTFLGRNAVKVLSNSSPSIVDAPSPMDVYLYPLADNGGPTKTMAPGFGSGTIDGALGITTPTDQRGFSRNRDGNGDGSSAPDIGAYEAQMPPVPSIGLNMQAGVNDGLSMTMDAGAGSFSQRFWSALLNNVNPNGASGDTTARTNSENDPLPGLKLWWKGAATVSMTGGPLDSFDKKLMEGFLGSNGSTGSGTATDLYNAGDLHPFVAVAGLPADLVLGGYKVVVYADSSLTDGRTARYWLTSNRSQNLTDVSTESALTPSLYTRDTGNFSGTYTRATATADTGASTAPGNYMIFDALAESGFIVRAEEGSLPGGNAGSAPLNAVQIVHNDIVVVTTTEDENDPVGTLGTGLSLREAMRDAPDGAGIVFDPELDGQTITLTSGLDLLVTKSVTIDASNLPSGITINGGSDQNRIFTVPQDKALTLVAIKLTGGNGHGQDFYADGGAIANHGTLNLRQCSLIGNNASGRGGAIFSEGILTLTGTTLNINSAVNGGAIFNLGTLSLTNCSLAGNYAAFNGSDQTGMGGAIYHDSTVLLTLTGCTFSINSTTKTAGAALIAILDESAQGGAIYLPDGKSLTITNCTFTGNSSLNNGGAIASLGTLSITHGTFSGNFIGGNGLGGYGGGIAVNGGTLALKNSIVAGNTSISGPDIYRHIPGGGVITPSGANLIGSNATVSTEFPVVGGGLVGIAANLGPLANNGGDTLTMLPQPGSRAIDAAVGSGTITDQRGFPRPVDGDDNTTSIADLGAVERGKDISRVITTAADSGPGSLRQALVDAAGALTATITFPASFEGPIVLSSEIDVPGGGQISIDGGNVLGGLVIDGGGTNRLFNLSAGYLTLNGLTLTGGYSSSGGAIFNGPGNTLILTNCTLSDNRTVYAGGAIYSDGAGAILSLLQCTFAGNTAGFYGGAIYTRNGASVTNSTLFGNSATVSGGGIELNGGDILFTNSIVAGNHAPTGPDFSLVSGNSFVLGPLLLSSLAGSNLTEGGNVIVTADPKLSPLGNYGGPTPTMLPLADSPAVDPALGASSTSVVSDQRGSVRAFGAKVDIGAVERGRIVMNSDNDGAGSLRAMVTNAGSGANFSTIINFDPSLDGQTINLTGTINLTKNLEINAEGLPSGITVNGGSLNNRLFVVSPGKKVALHNLKLINGGGTTFNDFGGAISNEGNLKITRCTLSSNKVKLGSTPGNSGGAIETYADTSLFLADCFLTQNEADFGGAITADTFSSVILRRCTLSGNHARNGHGGAINGIAAHLTLSQCTVADNTAIGASLGTTGGRNGFGGGIMNYDKDGTVSTLGLHGSLTLNHCTIAGNRSNGYQGYAYGGGVFYRGDFHIANTIIAGNEAFGDTGNDGSNPPVPFVSGPDLFESYFGTALEDFSFTGRVLIGNVEGTGFSVEGNGRVLTGDPQLAALGDYGGYAPSMPPLAGSQVIDKASSEVHFGDPLNTRFTTDQRGYPLPVNDVADLGAAESGNVQLKNLVLSAGTLSPVFSGATASYSADVPFGAANLTVTPTAAGIGASITVNDTPVVSGSASGSIALNVGSNTITVAVTGPQGALKTYIVNVTRAAVGSINADLSGLTLSTGTLNPAFSSAQTTYTVSAPGGTTSLTVTPTKADANATITVNGSAVASGAASSSIAVPSAITVSVTAEDGTTIKTYTVTVTVAKYPATLALSSSHVPSSYVGQSVTFTATVTGTGSPTGTVTFFDGTTSLGSVSLVNGVATLSTAGLSLGSHTMTATYSGDPAFDGATSSPFEQTVVVSPLNVGSTDNSGDGSLRQALLNAASSPGADVITFSPGFSGTIILEGEIILDHDVTIDASNLPGGITIDGGSGTNRLFTVNSGQSVTLSSLTLTGGGGTGAANSGLGGAVLNLGSLSLVRCTAQGNTAVGGGALAAQPGAATSLTGCTVTGNSAVFGGGIVSEAAALTLTHCTLVGNTGTGGTGGLVLINGTATVTNSIIAANVASIPTDIDLGGSGTAVTAQGANLIGNNSGSYASIFPAGPLAGTSASNLDPLLAPLGNYGGPTQTMALLPGSPARDAINSVTNPSFEANTFGGTFTYTGAITGWTSNAPSRTGLSQAGSPLADNGTIPDGTQVAFLQSFLGQPITLSTTLTGLVPGQSHTVTFRVNARNGYNTPQLSWVVTEGETSLFSDGPAPILPMGGTAPYHTITGSFIATATTATLAITNQTAPGTDSTLLLDAVTVALTVATTDQRGFPIVGTPDIGAYEAGTPGDFYANALENGTSTTPDADADHDGNSDLMEYATRGNTNVFNANPVSEPLPVTLLGNVPARQFDFAYRPESRDLRYIVRRSSDLLTWTEIYRLDMRTLQITRASGITSLENNNPGNVIITDPHFTPDQTFYILDVDLP